VILLLIAIGKPMIEIMAGPAFADAYSLLVLLGLATSFGMMGLGLDPLLQASGSAHLALMIRAFGIGLVLLLIYLLVPIWGATGAALALLIASAGSVIALLIITLKKFQKMEQSSRSSQ